MSTLTKKSLTDRQIATLRTEAAEAADYTMVAVCDLALEGEIDTDDYTVLPGADVLPLREMSRDEAYDRIVDAINDARAGVPVNPLEKLTHLSAQRTARTDRLHAAVRELTDALETAGAKPGEVNVTVDGWHLCYRYVRSNVGSRDCWSWGTGDARRDEYSGCTDLCLAVNHEGYLHGDFNAEINGPTRAHLIAFGQRAGRLVAAITKQVAAEDVALEGALANVSVAIETVK